MRLPRPILNESNLREFEPGQPIFKVGDLGDEMFVVQEGEVDILADGRLIETVRPEGFFGELALIDHAPRSADAVARTRCKLASLNEHRFLFMIDEVPFFALKVMKVMADRLRRESLGPR